MIRFSIVIPPGETVVNRHNTVSLVQTVLVSLRLPSRLAPESKPGRNGAVYLDSVNEYSGFITVYAGPPPPASNYPGAPGSGTV